ncbi:MAG: cysteine desulfurase NifS [Candidatus Auribacterota bacterium]|jgi:cysteine desulfurase|nr:cysteine desulfurase NifS [Candidatus Auribacterota bacterium]
MSVIYLDNNATTEIDPQVLESILPYLKSEYGNPSGMYTFAGKLKRDLDKARSQVAALINASAEEIIFTSCGTESDNTALVSALETYPEKRHIVTTRVEHSAILNMCKHLSRKGYAITFLPVDREGMIDLDELADSVTPSTAVVSIMYANNETGVVYPIEQIAQIVKSKGVLFHTDAVQAVGKLPVDMNKIPVDMLSLSGHKLHAPKGIGVLYIRKGTRFQPYIIGGHQEDGRRGGTENVASIVGLGTACEIAAKYMNHENTEVRRLRDKLENTLLSKISSSMLNGHKLSRLPNTTNISFEFIEGEAILLLLDEHRICASSGSACTSGSIEPSHVLRAMGVPFTAAHGSIRFSLSRYTTEQEIDKVIELLPPIVNRLRQMSPFWHEQASQLSS